MLSRWSAQVAVDSLVRHVQSDIGGPSRRTCYNPGSAIATPASRACPRAAPDTRPPSEGRPCQVGQSSVSRSSKSSRLRDNLERAPVNSHLQRRYLATLEHLKTELEAI